MFLYRIVFQYLLLYGAKVNNIFLIPTNDGEKMKYLDNIQNKTDGLVGFESKR